MNEHPLETLYNSLKRDNYDVPDTYESFARTLINDTNARRTLYNSLMRDNYDVPDNYDSFDNTLFNTPYTTKEANIAAGVDEESNRAQQAQQPTQRNMGTHGYVPNRFGIPTQQGMGPVADVAPHPMTPAQPLSFQERVQKSVGMAQNVGKAKADFSQRMSAIEQGNKPFSSGKAQQYDPTTGETKDVYYTTTGQAVSTPMERDVENIKNSPETKEREGKIKVREQIGDMTSEVSEALNQRGMELDDAALHNTLGDRPMGGGAMVHTFNSSTSNGRLSDERWRMLYAAKVAIDRANNMMREANTKGGIHNLGASEFVRGMGKVGNPDTWDMGLTEGVESTAMMVALQKADKGEELTREEQLLLDAKAVEMATAMFYASDLSGWYKAGEVTADALPFMLEMMINPAAKVGRSAQSMLTRYALKRFGKQALKRGGDKFVKGALRRFGGRAGIDLLGASYLTTTSSLPRVGADAISRMNGDVQFNTNEEGNIQYAGHTKGEDWWNAWSKGYLSTLTENYSEMLGEYFAPLFKWLGKGIGRGATNLADTKFGRWLHLGGGIDKVEDFIKGVSAHDMYKFISDLEENAQWHGILGEYAEEVVGGIMNAILVGDQTLDADPDTGVFNLKKNLETLQGVAVMGGFFSAMKTVGYRNPAHVARRAMRKADRAGASAFGEQWESIRSMIDGGQSDAFDDTWDGMTDSQKQAILEYTKAAYTYKGIAEGNAKRDAEGVQTQQEAEAEQSYNTGYEDANTDELRSDINMAYTDARQTLVGLIGEDAVNEIDNDPLAMQAQYDQDMTVDDNTKSAIAEYVSAKSAWDGVQQRISDDAADRADQRRAEGEKMAYKGKGDMQGAIRPLIINEESKEEVVNPQTGEKERKKKTVYLVNGNIAIEPNGNGLSREGTDKTIYVYDPETGEAHELDPFAGAGVLEVGEPISMEDYLANNEQQSQAEVQQAAETAQGKVKVNTPFETPQGRKGVVQSIEGDNAIVLFADGEMEQASMPLAEVQQYADALRRKEYEARHPQTPAEQPQQPNTTTEGQNTVGAEVAAEYLLGSGANAINSTDYLLKALSGIFSKAQGDIEAIRQKYQQQFAQEPYAEIDNFVNSDQYEQIVGEVRNAINAAYGSNSIEAQSILDEILKSPKGLPNRTGQDISRRVESLNAEQTTPQEGNNAAVEQPQVEYPRDKQGNIDYDKIDDAATFATALGEEFGEDAPATLDDIIAEETAKMKKQNAVGKARIRKRLAMLEEAKAQLKPTEEAPAEAPTETPAAEVEQPSEQITPQAGEVPDMSVDKASDARARGYRMQSGVRYDRQGATEGVVGSETEVKFTNKEKPVKGRWKVVEGGSVQPSHIGGQNNPLHFITEAQPKDRTDRVSDAESEKIAANINPKEIIDGVTAYTGAPVVNSRGEVIQGNNRATALRKMGGYAESAARYKQYLIDHAADYGLNAEDIAKMQNPVMVREVDVTDNEAIRLGQFTASDTESGGKERISADKVLGKLTDEQTASVLNIMLRGGEETDETLMQLIDRNGADVLTYLAGQGAINDTQVQSAYGRDGRMTPEAKNDLADMVTQNIFKGGADNIKKVWNEYLPVAAQKALLQAMAGDLRLPKKARLIEYVRNAIMVVGEIKNNPFTKEAKTAEDYHKGLDMDARQADMLSRPIKERYSELELYIAVDILLTKKQNAIKAIFGDYQRLFLEKGADLFEAPKEYTPEEAIEKAFGIKLNKTDNNEQGTDTGGSHETGTSETGETAGNGELGRGERQTEGEPGADTGAAEQAAVSKYEEAESAFFGFLEWTNLEYGTNYDWNSLMSFLKWANKKAKAKEQPLRKFVHEWIGDKYPPKDAAELTDKIFAALKEREDAKKAETSQQPKEEAEGGTETAPQPVGGVPAQGETPAEQPKSGRTRRTFKKGEKKSVEQLFEEEKAKYAGKESEGNEYAEVLAMSETVDDAVSEFNRRADAALKEADDWRNRFYKPNNAIVEGQNGADEYTTTIGAANERRRESNIKRLEDRARELQGYAETLKERTGYTPAAEQSETWDEHVNKVMEAYDKEYEAIEKSDGERLRKEAAEYSDERLLNTYIRNAGISQIFGKGREGMRKFIGEEKNFKAEKLDEVKENNLEAAPDAARQSFVQDVLRAELDRRGIEYKEEYTFAETSEAEDWYKKNVEGKTEEPKAAVGETEGLIEEMAAVDERERSLAGKPGYNEAYNAKAALADRIGEVVGDLPTKDLQRIHKEAKKRGMHSIMAHVESELLKRRDAGKKQRADGKAARVNAKERKLRDAVVDLLRNAGIDVVTESEEVQRVLDMANGRERQHRVYHGSGADFEAFDHSHMGEGEGAQAFGWGTYVTEVKGIGKSYAQKGARNQKVNNALIRGSLDFFWKGQPIDQTTVNPLQLAAGVVYDSRTIAEARNSVDKYIDYATAGGNAEMAEKWKETLDILKESKKSDFTNKPHKGNTVLYTVEIPEDNGSNYLDWSLTIPKRDRIRIAEAVRGLEGEPTQSVKYANYTGGWGQLAGMIERNQWAFQEVRDRLLEAFGGRIADDKKVSELMHDAGFVGIKYPADYYNGGRADNAKNYVIFNESDLQITDKVKFFRTENGEAYGFTMGGKIYLDPKIATAETPIHEYTHLWAAALRAANPKAWEQLKSELEKDKDLMAYVQRLYPELKGDELMDEVFAHFSGRRGAERLRAEQERMEGETRSIVGKAKVIAMFENLRNALKKFWNAARELFGGKVAEGKSAEDFADMVLGDLVGGFKPDRVDRLDRNDRERDAEYMEAVESGDMEKAQRMVNEAAKRAGYIIEAYHGTPNSMYSEVFTKALADAFSIIFPNEPPINPNAEFLSKESSRFWNEANGIISNIRKLEPMLPKNIVRLIKQGDKVRFNTFDKSRFGSSTNAPDAKGFFFSPDEDFARHFTSKYEVIWPTNKTVKTSNGDGFMYHVYIKPGKILDLTKMSAEKSKEAQKEQMIKGWGDYDMVINKVKDNHVLGDKKVKIEISVKDPDRIKLADPVTYDENGNVIPLSERFNSGNADIRYQRGATDSDVRFRGEEEPVFYSNAMRAVENIKQERATPEQWVKMIEKQGGLKAGEDKWLGLSEWLKGSEAKTLTKGEVLDYIRANEIQVEEVEYDNNFDYDQYFEETEDGWKFKGDDGTYIKLSGAAYLNGSYYGAFYDLDTAKRKLASEKSIKEVQPIHETRLSYTTRGLDNKREIVLTVPTIEPWNEHDEVHFGEAGGGRAVAWVRFGETTDADGKRVLVIDEIQSKRHQEGREKGYRKEDSEYDEAMKRKNALLPKYQNGTLTPEETEDYQRAWDIINSRIKSGRQNTVPDAPFDKNWHEVAMKRMLRYAAENGYDKVAWTKGEQQAERYDIGNAVSSIEKLKSKESESLSAVVLELKDRFGNEGGYMTYHINDDGIIRQTYDTLGTPMEGDFVGKPLSDVIGKELAQKIIKSPVGTTIDGEGLRIGGEGMKGFYDQILPRFMDKYGKKWGVKTGEVELPNIGDNGLTMWSVDVTDDMRESVMRGQPLFRNLEESDNVVNNADAGTRPLTDREKIAKLESEPKVKVYRSMQLIYGKLYPPMSARVDGQLREPSEIGVWEEAEEHPELADENGKFKLDKGNKKSLKAAYNPYIHTSRTMLNDQFSEAQSRPNLVVVEVEIPESELNGTYKAEKAKDSVGAKQWKAGVIQGQLSGTREVILSRWAKPVRIVPDAEVAENIARQIEGQVSVMPSNVVTPQVRAELEKRGVRFVETDNTGRLTSGSRKGETWAQVYGKNATKQREGGEEAYAGEWYDRNSVERIGEFAGYSPKQIAKMNARQEESARNKFRDAAEKLHLSDNITFADTIDDVPGLTDKERRDWRRKKGWYSPRTGKIVIILGNHRSMDDVMKSILHEGVAHHGLRQLFGEHFNTFLDNVYKAASPEIRERIYAMAKKHGWDFRTATEEYLAMLAEDTDFERPENQSWWGKVKAWFFDMLHKIGFKLHDAYDTITDNELRYVLWRSYQNLVNPGRYNSVVEEAKDIAKQYDLRVGEWDESRSVEDMGPNATMEFNGRRVPIWATNGRRGNRADRTEREDRMGSDYNVAAEGVAEDENTQGYKEWESERQYKKAKELLTALHNAGYKDFYISRSITDFGVSTYIQGMYGAKFRLSDHSVTRIDRLIEEEHITHNTTPESVVATVKEYEKMAKERNKAFDDMRKREKQLDEKWERIKPLFDGLVFKRNERTYQNFETFSSKGNRSNILQIPTTKGAFKYEWTEPKEPNDLGKEKPSYEWLEAFDEEASEVNTVRFRDGEDEENDSEERESIEQLANNMSIGTSARFAAVAARNAQESHDNAEALAAALNFTSQNLAEIVEATKAQKKFDKATVKQVTDMARVMVSAGYLDSMGRADVKGLLKAIRESTGETDNTDNVNRIIDIMVKNQLKNQENTLATLLKIKGSRVDARGINVQGKLDPNGQQTIKAFKDNMKEQRETIESRIADAEERMTSEDRAIADAAYNEKVGLQLALDYVEKIGQSKADEKDIEAKKRAELSKVYDYTRVVDVDEQGNALFKKDGTERTHEVRHVRAEYKGKISDEKKAERERVEQTAAAMDDAIRHMRMERIDAYTDFIAQVAGNMKESMRKLEERREAEKRRIEEIHHNANSDMEGRPASEHRSDTGGVLNWINNTAGGTLFAPLASFGEMLRMFGRKSPNGEGYLFNRFMRGLIDARHKELNGVHDKYSELDKKAQAVFGGKVETWADMMNVVRKGENIAVEWFDGKEKVPHTLHQGNLMYIYMVNKMSDGRMKLRHMGIDEKAMAVIESKLDPRLKEIADWLQEDFLVRSRNEYNETHKRMFGASMSAIEDYFPLVINSGSRNKDAEKEDAAENNSNTITTATGAIKKRTVNVVDLDLLNADAMHVILDHIAEMEHWNAFAEYNRDLNTLRSYKRFENQVKNMTTILGDGEQTWKAFNKTAQIAVGSYQKAQSDLDAKSLEFASKVTAAKVAFRINTALKQLLSLPAYLPYANASGFYHALANDLGNGTAPWKWCMKNLPMYRERWESRVSGDPRLLKLTNDWKSQRATRLQKISRAGMLPNAAVDALTVSIGAHAVYETRKAQYLKEGYSEAAAEKRAIQDAEIAYNETQQSSEGGFVSVMQVDKSWLNVLFTIFRNASMAYQRQLHGAMRNLINMRTKARREQAKEFLAKQIARDGVNEAQARLAAEQRFNRAMRKNWIAVATFGYIVQLAWNFGGQMWYLLFGDDDDKKKKTWKDILIHSLFGGVEGLTGGDWLSELGRQIATGDRNPQSLNKDMPLTSDMFAIIEKFGQGREWEAVSDIINLAVQAGVGANPQTLTDAVAAAIDACNGDLGLAREASLFAMRVIQVPQSQTEQIYFDEIGMTGEEARKLSYEQLVERYAKYRVKRNFFWTPWEWDNEKALEKGEKRGERIIKERMETMSDEQLEEALSNLFESSGEKGKKLSFNQYAKREGLKGYDYSDATKNDGAKYYMNIATWRDIAEDITLHHETKKLEDEIKRLKKLGVRENEVAYWQTDDKLKDLNKVKKEIGEMKKEMVDANGNPMSEEIINSRMEDIRTIRRNALYPEQAANPTDNVEE